MTVIVHVGGRSLRSRVAAATSVRGAVLDDSILDETAVKLIQEAG